jgi:3-oxo-4-pregnene-20-carboxyl-CoA dehydrogenase alpha subunit
VDFALTEAQREIAGLAGQRLEAGKADPWKELAQAGLLSLCLPPDLGGDGLGVLEAAVLLTEVGRRAVPVPALATLMTGVLPVVRWGDADLRRSLLPGMAAAETILTAGIREPSDPMPEAPAVTVTAGTVTGTKVGVPYGAQASRVLVPVSFPAAGDGRTGVVIIDPAGPGASLTPAPAAGRDPQYTLRLDQAPVERVLGDAACVRDLYQLAVAGACSLADGALAGALELTRAHVATREQFGRPLAAFQAVAQQVADVYIAARTLHLATLSACWRLDAGLDAAADLAVAGYWCARQAPRAALTCHHLHGGTGMDTTYPLHHLSGLIADLARFLGGAEYQLERQECSSS